MNKIEQHNSATETILTLLQTKGLGRKTVKKIIDIILDNPNKSSLLGDVSSLNNILQSDKNLLKNTAIRIKIPDKSDLAKGNSSARMIIEESKEKGIKIINYFDKSFPQRLRSISDSPLILFVQGNERCLWPNNEVAVIGTRNPSDYGLSVAWRIGSHLAQNGIIVVSGLAEGIDAAAQQGCVDSSGQTVAVLAHGHGFIYPASNRDLAEDIVKKKGCLISEYPPLEKPTRYSFVDRDRLQSGLSSAVLVVETAEKGGTMHTADFCVAQGRTLWALRNPSKETTTKYTAGYRKLLNEYGAKPINWDDGAEVKAFVKEIRDDDFLTIKEIFRQKTLVDYY